MPVGARLVVPSGPGQRRRTAQILDAVRSELESRRNVIDGDNGIRSVTITVKMVSGTESPRAVIINVESEKTLSNS